MMKRLLFILLMASASVWCMAADRCNDRLYFRSPAKLWEETLPLGNGRLGMMPDGGIAREKIVLNEISLWSGSECDYSNPEAARSLPRIRQLLFEGKNLEAQKLMYSSFVPKKQETDGRYGTYQVLGKLTLDFGNTKTSVNHYSRSLSLDEGVARTRYTDARGVEYERTYYVSRTGDVMVIHLRASKPGALNVNASLSRPAQAECSLDTATPTLVMTGQLDSGNPDVPGMKYRTALRIVSPTGKITSSNGAQKSLGVSDAQEAWIVISATTSFSAPGTDFPGDRYAEVCDSLLNAAASLPATRLAAMQQKHSDAHGALYHRVSVNLPTSATDTLPTNERLTRFATEASPSMAALYYNYGRYLLISSTRPGSLPPNLQGLWANGTLTPWNGDYHTNINIQMNHWPLEQAALPELIDPLTTLIERLIPSGKESARAFYGEQADGWVLHMMTNIWNYTAPGEHPSWGATNTGGVWLCAHLWDHYLYTRDVEYLRRVYPILKGAATFFLSTSVAEPTHGWKVTAPTSSPENTFYLPFGSRTPVSVCMGPTMDVQLLTELYSNVIAATRVLKTDHALAARLEKELRLLPPMQISPKGYLQEWLDDYEEVDVHHRHVSHLYGLHPANLISPEQTPELAEACRATLNRRGDEATGWSRAWKMNFWARLHDGDRAWKLFRSLLQPAVMADGSHGSGTFPNLFCSHPPFQIDGNYGGAAGVGEMLLQSHNGYINLLPALPASWDYGKVEGMRVRGCGAISFEWQGGTARRASLKALKAGSFTLKMPRGCQRATVIIGGKVSRHQSDFFKLTLGEGEEAAITFTPQVRDLPRSTPEAEGVPSEAVTALFDSLTSLPQTDIHSVMVVRHGKVIGEIYPAPFAPEYRHTMYSCSKTFVGIAVGLAIADNRLRLTDRVAAFFPELLPDSVSPHLAGITVRHLLTMTTGIAADWEMRNHCTDWIKTYLGKTVKEPGKKFEYDSLCTYLLSAIVQKATGKSVLALLRERVFTPMHITEVGWEVSPEGYNTGGWGLHIQSESLAKMGILFLNKGNWQGRQLVPAEWIEQMTAHQMKTWSDDYGYQMWHGEYPGSTCMDGALGQYVMMMPDKDMVVVITECTLINGITQRRLVWNRLMPAVTDTPLTPGKAYGKLQKKQTSYTLPTVRGRAASPQAKQWEGKTLQLSTNPYGWQSLRLYFGDKQIGLTVTETSGRSYTLPLGYRQWLTTPFEGNPPYSVAAKGRLKGLAQPFHAAGSYAWLKDGALQLKIHYVDFISALQLTLRPDGEAVTLRIGENYSTNEISLKGTLSHE